MSKKTFRIYNDLGFEKFVSPIGDIRIKGSLEKDEFFHNKQLENIKLHKGDYDSLIVYEDSFLDFFIEVRCKNNLLFKGKFKMISAQICKDKCYMILNIKEDSLYECLKNNDVERNIIATSKLSKVSTTYNQVSSGNIIVVTYDEWLTLSTAEQNTYGIIVNDGVFGIMTLGKYFNTEQCLNGTNVPVGGTLVDDFCDTLGYYTYTTPYNGQVYGGFNNSCPPQFPAIPFYAFNSGSAPCDPNLSYVGVFTQTVFNPNTELDIYVEKSFGSILGTSTVIDSGYLLNDVIEYLATETGCVSCFNSSLLNDSTNYVTGESPNPLSHITITEMSDISNASAPNPATIFNLSFFGLYEKLKEVIPLIYKIDSTGCLSIEHESLAIDNVINIEDIGDVIIDPCCYSVNLQDIPRFETWVWNEADGFDFKGLDIQYRDANGEYFVNNNNSIEHDVECVTTDLEYIYDQYPLVDNLNGFVLIANSFDGINYEVINEDGVITGEVQANGHLSQANLHDKYWRHNRYLPTGELNNNQTAFLSQKPYKENDDIKIRVCCENLTDGLNFDFSKIRSSCGEAIISSYDFDLKTDTLTITPIF